MVTESSPSRRRTLVFAAGAAVLTLALTSCGGGSAAPDSAASGSAAAGAGGAAGVESLLDAQRLTVLDQPITYPRKSPAQVTSSIAQLEPGQETGWHKYKVPVYAYVLEGTLTVEYDAGVVKEYPAGTALMQAQDIWQNGTNKADVPVRVLTVFMGAKGAKNSVERSP
jgi:quercetin dioxygenase-like cupin family protein